MKTWKHMIKIRIRDKETFDNHEQYKFVAETLIINHPNIIGKGEIS